jgi:hypothetical protein
MEQNTNQSNHIHCKIEIIPHERSTDPTLQIILDKHHPQISETPEQIIWKPSPEEQQFLKKIFNIFTTQTIPSSLDSFFEDLQTKEQYSSRTESDSQQKNHTCQEPPLPPVNTTETIEKTIEKHRTNNTNTDASDKSIDSIINKQKQKN